MYLLGMGSQAANGRKVLLFVQGADFFYLFINRVNPFDKVEAAPLLLPGSGGCVNIIFCEIDLDWLLRELAVQILLGQFFLRVFKKLPGGTHLH